MHAVEAFKIEIGPIHNIYRPRFWDEFIKDVNVMDLCLR